MLECIVVFNDATRWIILASMNWQYDIYLYLQLALQFFGKVVENRKRKINKYYFFNQLRNIPESTRICSSPQKVHVRVKNRPTDSKRHRHCYLSPGLVLFGSSSLSKEPQPAAGRCIFNQTARVEGCYVETNFSRMWIMRSLNDFPSSLFFLSFFLLRENNASLREFTNFLSCSF